MRALVLYSTEEGQTKKIARRISHRLSQQGIPNDRHHLTDHSANPALDAYDAVIVGASIHYCHYAPELADFLKDYKGFLNEIPSAFYSVSLGILSHEVTERAQLQQITDDYLLEIGWNPEIKRYFAGALAYSKYGWIKRHVMHWIMTSSGTDGDMSEDREFTAWQRVDEFADDFATFAKSCRAPASPQAQRSIYSEPARPYSTKYRHAARP